MSSTLVKSLDALEKGGVAVLTDINEPQIRSFAKQNHLRVHIVDGSKAKSASALYRAVAQALDFPEYYNSRTDDFYSFLTDAILMEDRGCFIWLHGLDLNNSVISKAHAEILEAFHAAVHFAKDHQRTLVVVSDPSITAIEQIKEYVA